MMSCVSLMLLCAAVLFPVSLGCMPAHRGRIMNLGLAGVMVIGGWAGAQAAHLPIGDGWAAACGIGIAGCAGAAMALGLGAAVMRTAPDEEIGGTVMNLLFVLPALLISGREDGEARLASALEAAGEEGAWSLFIPLGFLLTLLMWLLLHQTKRGIAWRAAGENPGAAAEAGAGAYAPRIAALLLAGALGGIGGLAWRLHGPDDGALQTAGLALLALAALNFGGSRGWRVLLAAALLSAVRGLAGAADAADSLRALNWPREIWRLLPYLAALLLCIVSRRWARESRAWLGYGNQSQGRNTP